MKAKIGRRLTDSETDKAAVLASYIDGSPHEWPHAVSEVALVCHGYLDQQARIRELEAELAVRDNISNEVLRILREATGRRDFHSEMEAAEYAAEIIRESGWQSLHPGLDRETGLTCGMWEQLPNGKHRWYVCPQQMCPGFAIQRGYTHYLPEPAPPSREVTHDGE